VPGPHAEKGLKKEFVYVKSLINGVGKIRKWKVDFVGGMTRFLRCRDTTSRGTEKPGRQCAYDLKITGQKRGRLFSGLGGKRWENRKSPGDTDGNLDPVFDGFSTLGDIDDRIAFSR